MPRNEVQPASNGVDDPATTRTDLKSFALFDANRVALASIRKVTPARKSSGPERNALCAPSGWSSTACPLGQVSSAF
ncbi:MAG TPA: hypothetical protein VNV86_15145 [Candidatus Acidoferrum sp.]|nr:hypothetical protein [Candidatus Acidoferrum sp.]